MIDEGYLDNDPLMHLINLKWYLRAVTNAIIDQAIHVDGMTRDAAMKLMIEGGFQEEREAAGKWVRAQLTSTQLSTYFVGYQEHIDMRTAGRCAPSRKPVRRRTVFHLRIYRTGPLAIPPALQVYSGGGQRRCHSNPVVQRPTESSHRLDRTGIPGREYRRA